MSILDIFRTAPAASPANLQQDPNKPATLAPAQQQVQQLPGSVQDPMQTAVSQQTAPNGVVPNQQTQQQQQTPLDQFKDIWQPVQVNPEEQKPMFQGIDAETLSKAAAQVNFAQSLTPEIMQQIKAGGDAGVQATLQAMNNMAQQVYAKSALASTKLIESAVSKTREELLKEIPTLVKQQGVSESLRQHNAAFSNPAVQPLVQAVEMQLTQKHPTASSSEITEMAKNYISEVGKLFSPQAPTQKQQVSKSEDWDTFFKS